MATSMAVRRQVLEELAIFLSLSMASELAKWIAAECRAADAASRTACLSAVSVVPEASLCRWTAIRPNSSMNKRQDLEI